MIHRLLPGLLLVCAFLPSARALEPVQVADTVYAFIGNLGELGADNGGDIGNSGFIVGRSGVIVVDTGSSYRHGKAMIAAIQRITDKPIELVIITHAVQEFLFGNAAFAERNVRMVTHAKSAELMRERCEHCIENLRKMLGQEAMTGTRLVVPESVVEQSTTLEVAGRTLELLYFGWASTPGDLAVLDRDSGVLFAGGLVSDKRIPELRDGNFDGWLQALDRLARVPARVVVPGHGQAGGAEMIEATANYLRALDDKVQALYKSGASLMDAVDNAALPDYSLWALYPSLHRANALHRYLQLELREFGG